ncbi:GNAT family N-acetyltransferase [Mangrovibacillus cuniculi]|uniref:GNAT family N-acetyltransferase n=1 Tax=Mangrovibacillus cuniculi TaxID=2593652 RepID=A0A7S8CD66_9BACI|nr:GNAT family N-acetyltransferase [Mangrovibacillus cuniculi]QPC47822.1 GNAT family N-acetyltransferase [Mangrovibacillus cuniculi]
MNWTVEQMKEDYANEIMQWRYPAPYDFYHLPNTDDVFAALMNDMYYVVIDDREEMVGFFCTGNEAQVPSGNTVGAYAEDCIDIGLGMKPSLTGNGLGKSFFGFILDQVQMEEMPFRVTVATFNQRAICLYGKFGFVQQHTFLSPVGQFVTMRRNP